MLAACTAIAFVLVMLGVAVRADRRLPPADRLPMQWSLGGGVNWTAPRGLALAFIPALGTGVLALLVLSLIVLGPRPGQEGLAYPVLLFMGCLFLAIQGLHIGLAARTLRP